MKDLKPVLKRDIIIIFAAVILSVIMLCLMKNNYSGEKYAQIRIDGETVKTVELSESKAYCFTVDELDGVEFEVENGKIRVKSSDCKDKICVNTRFIENINETVICLPKKMYIIIAGEDNADFDAVVG